MADLQQSEENKITKNWDQNFSSTWLFTYSCAVSPHACSSTSRLKDKMESALSQMKCRNKTVPDHAKKIWSW